MGAAATSTRAVAAAWRTLRLERLRHERLSAAPLSTPAEIVGWFGAVQSQEYPAAKWGVALRSRHLTDAALDADFDAGRILRTHVLRPTWHFVTPADIRWLQALTGPRVLAATRSYLKRFEIDDALLARSARLLTKALRDGRHLTRPEIAAALAPAGIEASGVRLSFIVMHAELTALICSGPRRGRQFTYALLDERVPASPPLTADESLHALATRYFASHGPASARDFRWWSGLTMGQVRRAIASLQPTLTPREIDGVTYWSLPMDEPAVPAPAALLLPVYDEYLVAFQDRALLRDAARPFPAGGGDAYGSYLVLDGVVSGTWRRPPSTSSLRVEPHGPLTTRHTRALAAQARRYAAFLGRDVTLEVGGAPR